MIEVNPFAFYQAHSEHLRGIPLTHSELIDGPRGLVEVAARWVRENGVITRVEGKTIQRVHLVSVDRGYVWRITDQEVEVIDGKVESKGNLANGLLMEGLGVIIGRETSSIEDIDRDEGEEVFVPAVLRYIDLPRDMSFDHLLMLGVTIHPVTLQDTAAALKEAQITDEEYFNRMMGTELAMQALHKPDMS